MFVHINVDNLLNTGDRNMSMFDTKLDCNCTIYFTGMKYCLHVNDYKDCNSVDPVLQQPVFVIPTEI